MWEKAMTAPSLEENAGQRTPSLLMRTTLLKQSVDCNRPLNRLYGQEPVSFTEHCQWFSQQVVPWYLQMTAESTRERRQRRVCKDHNKK